MPQHSNPQLKILGTIDLSDINRPYRNVNSVSDFQLIYLKARYGEQPETIIFKFNKKMQTDETTSTGSSYFSLVIGRNGVGKSMLLRAIVDFFIEAQKEFDGTYRKFKPLVDVLEVCYILNGDEYVISRIGGSKFTYQYNGNKVQLSHMKFPLVISSTMGMFDKFPVNSPLSFGRKTRYSVPYYRYAGPKVSGNMYSSKTNVLLSTLYLLKNLTSHDQVERICKLLQFLGYEKHISIEYMLKTKGIKTQTPIYDKVMSDSEIQQFYSTLINGQKYSEDIHLGKTSIKALKSLPCKQVYGMKQANILSYCRIIFYRKVQLIDCEQLSSGEFNMLTIVLNAILSPIKSGILLLLDEPEISQHPNWQIDVLSNLDRALTGYKCHVLAATHSHFLVSDLPIDRSDVLCMGRDSEDSVTVSRLEHETYGWSSEEVLLKVFDMPTDRNRYLAEVVGKLMTNIAQNNIRPTEVHSQLVYLKRVSQNLSDVDPLKKVIGSIVKEFNA